MENEHVQDLLNVMQENRIDAKNLVAMLGYVAAVERQLDKAVGELFAMRQELATMREERNHPIRTALARAIVMLENRIDQTRAALETLKSNIVSGCKNALEAFKRGGRDALNNVARFFRLKPALESMSKRLDSLIKANDRTVAQIETMSAEYHSAGLHVKNVARVLAGKEPLQEIKPNGKLAKLIEAPFKTVRRMRANAKGNIDRALVSLERLEKEASVRERKPSVLDDIKKYRAMAEQAGRDAPERTRAAKQHDAAI
jgi:hypothetical protein